MPNMADLVESLSETYREMWGVEAYQNFSPGLESIDFFENMADPQAGASILDAGCGSGKAALELERRGYQVAMCDLIGEAVMPEARSIPFKQAVLWQSLGGLYQSLVQNRKPLTLRFDYVYCCDVLEHLPKEWTMLAVRRMMDIAENGLFLSIAFLPDNFGLQIGQPLHLTVEPFTWWRDNLRQFGKVSARDRIHSGLFMVEPQ